MINSQQLLKIRNFVLPYEYVSKFDKFMADKIDAMLMLVERATTVTTALVRGVDDKQICFVIYVFTIVV